MNETRIFGAPEHRNTQAEDLTAPVTPLNDLDRQLERVFAHALKTSEGRKKSDHFSLPAAEEIDDKKRDKLIRDAKAVLFREHQRSKRLKKIKSKVYR